MKNSIGQTACRMAGLWVAAMGTAATAGPPFATDDPEPVEYRHYEFYVASQYARAVGDQVTYTGPHVEYNTGAAPNLQLHLIAPYVHTSQPGAPDERGYGDTELGAKFRFVQEGPRRPMVGIFPLVELSTGSAARGLGSGHTQLFLPLWLQKSWGKWSSYGGGGYWINPGAGNQNWVFAGWQVQREISPRLALGTELFHGTPSVAGGSGFTGFNIGAIVNPNEFHHVLLSIGRDLQGSNRFRAYVGFQWTGPGGSKSEKAHSGSIVPAPSVRAKGAAQDQQNEQP